MGKPKTAITYTEQLQRIIDDYILAEQPWPATTRQIATWAIQHRLWQPHRDTLVGQCAEQLSRAMREDYIKDPQGRTVRAKLAARYDTDGEQLVLWADIRTAEPEHMFVAFQQRRQQIVGDCRQLKTDVDSYNDNARPPEPIQMVFDFTDNLRELEALERVLATV